MRKAMFAPIDFCEGVQIGASLAGVVGIGDTDAVVEGGLFLPLPPPTKFAFPQAKIEKATGTKPHSQIGNRRFMEPPQTATA